MAAGGGFSPSHTVFAITSPLYLVALRERHALIFDVLGHLHGGTVLDLRSVEMRTEEYGAIISGFAID